MPAEIVDGKGAPAAQLAAACGEALDGEVGAVIVIVISPDGSSAQIGGAVQNGMTAGAFVDIAEESFVCWATEARKRCQ